MTSFVLNVDGLGSFTGDLQLEYEPTGEPEGWVVNAGDGNRPCVVMMDEFFDDRSDKLQQTNMTFPYEKISSTGAIGGKEIVDIYGTTWWDWIKDLLGEKNAYWFAMPADGYMDTRKTDPVTGELENRLPLMACPNGGALQNIVETINKNGSYYERMEALDFYSPPEKVDGVWLYKGKALSWETHPHLFSTRTNRVVTKLVTWLTPNKINAATDGGLVGGKGDEHWPLIVKHKVALHRSLVNHYPALPSKLLLYSDSIIVNGSLMTVPNPKEITIDAYCFRGSDTYVKDIDTQLWYLADTMLVTAERPYPGNGFDYRCYVARATSPNIPWMGKRGYRSPVCGWKGYTL